MNKKLETIFRSKVRNIIESFIREEGLMPPPASDFKAKTEKPRVPIRVGGARVLYKEDGTVVIANEKGKQVAISEEDAVKVANYIIRLSGKI
jgi:hypothetical protein